MASLHLHKQRKSNVISGVHGRKLEQGNQEQGSTPGLQTLVQKTSHLNHDEDESGAGKPLPCAS